MRYLMLVLLVLSGCEDHSQPVLQPTKREFFENGRRSLERTTFDGCDYIVLQNHSSHIDGDGLSITHAGNCRNPIHRMNAEKP